MAEARRGYQIEDLFRLKGVSDAQISPDGTRVAYVISTIDREADQTRTAIWVVNADGSDARPLTGGRNDSQPRWSPDGRHLAFVSARENGTAQAFILPLTGGEARRLTSFPRGVHELAWSPDGATLALVARVGGPEGPREKREALPKVITTLRHKFNGQGFFDSSRRHIFLVPAAGGDARQLTDGDFDDGQIAWSPDGRTIAFISARHEGRDRDQAQDIWTVSVDGGEPRRLTDRFGPCAAPEFSPDGSRIAFAGHTDPQDGGGRTVFLWEMPAAGGEPRNVTAALDRGIQAGPLVPGAPPARVAWTGDGRAVLARVQDGADVHLVRVAMADGTITRLIGGEQTVESFSQAADGTVAAVVTGLLRPAEVEVLAPAATETRRITTTNDAWLSELRFPEVEPVRVTLPDGRGAEGWVFKPLDMERGTTYPLVLDVHGGPHAAFLHQFRGAYPLALPTLGCAVLQMNPSGSTGWGEDFARSLHGVRGERDLPEMMAAIDHLIGQGWVDPERLGITGYSYGGYITAWAITRTHRFKAAVCGAGTPNLYVHFAYSDMNIQRYAEFGSPWEAREHYLRLSPISYVQNVQTPILLLHGDADLRANIAQAEEFFAALLYLGKEAVMVRYPGENHSMRLAGKPSNRLDYDQRLIAWFAERIAIGGAVTETLVPARLT